MSLTKEEIQRYNRQIILKEVGVEGQEKIKAASVLIVGVGGLGSPAALYLAAAGIGRIGLIDFDRVDVSNLHRQILFSTAQQSEFKAVAAKKRLLELNPLIEIETYAERLSTENAMGHFARYDYILDGADNFSTRYLVNDASYFSKKTLVSASILGFEGQLAVFNLPDSVCYRCLYPEPPPAGTVQSCAEAGVFGVLPSVMGSLQATEVLKLVLGLHHKRPELLIYDALNMQFTNLEISKNEDCPLCGSNASIKNLKEENFVCRTDKLISSVELKKLMSEKQIQLLDVREAFERDICRIEPSLHIPLSAVENSLNQISQETPLIIYCKSGVRSAKACEILSRKGFNCINLSDGILGWINNVDPTLTKY